MTSPSTRWHTSSPRQTSRSRWRARLQPEWDLIDAVTYAVVVFGADHPRYERVDPTVVRAVVWAWYRDERHGFNAEHIALGGEG